MKARFSGRLRNVPCNRSCLISRGKTHRLRNWSNEDGERSAEGRRPVIQTLFQKKTWNGRPSRGNTGIKGCGLQDAGLNHLRHPVHCAFRQALPNLLRRRMFVNRPYSTCGTLGRTITRSDAHRQCRDGEQYYKRAPTPAPQTFEICEPQHVLLRRLP